jgi:hypothetical protein
MTRLGEATEDEYLSPGEQTEERVGSADYDVWLATASEREPRLGEHFDARSQYFDARPVESSGK